MKFKTFVCVLFVVHPLLGVPVTQTPRVPQQFRRDAVESPPQSFRTSENYYTKNNEFGDQFLPLRSAVESIPEIYSTRMPLRDAVERRLPPEVNFESEIEIFDEIPHDYVAPYRISNPYQQIIGVRRAKNIQEDVKVEKKIERENVTKEELEIVMAAIAAFYPYEFSENTTEAEFYEILDRIFSGEVTSPPELLVPAKSIKNAVLSYDEIKQMIENIKNGNIPNLTQKIRNLGDGNENLKEKPQTYKTDFKDNKERLVCYFDASSSYRIKPFNFKMQYYDPRICTHLIYAYAKIDAHSFTLVPQDHDYDVIQGGYRSITALKHLNPHLKVLISIGEDRENGGHKFSNLVTSASKRRDFIKSLIRFLDEYGFDGVDIHWQYPGAEELGGKISDKENFSNLLEELSEIFQSRDWILSVSVPASRFRIDDGFDPKYLSEIVDFVNLQSYDFNIEKDAFADHHSPLLRRESDLGLNVFYNVDYAVRYWLKKGLNRKKLNLGIGFHARTFQLKFGNSTQIGALVKGIAPGGPYTQQPGLLAYFELCDIIQNEGWIQETDEIGSPYAHNGAQWAGYETPESIKKKVSYAQDLGLGGIAVWSVDLDDFRGICGAKYPLLNAVKGALYNTEVFDSTNPNYCSEGDGLYSDPLDCSKYRICKNGVTILVSCTDGQMYDPILGKCDKINPENCQPGVSVRYHLNGAQITEIVKSNQKSTPKIVCYVTNWSFYRKNEGKFVPEHIDSRLCTHIVFAFASLEPEKLILQSADSWADIDNNLYSRITALEIPVLLAIGGWTDSFGDKYSKLVSDGSARRRFVTSAVSFLRKYNFRGLHFDWNYPVCWQSNCQKGPANDKANFAKLIQELRAEFDKTEPKLLLAVSISGYKEVIEVAYDLPVLGMAVDFLSVMTYDYHGHWETQTGHISPLFGQNNERYPQYNSKYTIDYLVGKGAPKHKLLLGVPFYGQTFTLGSKGSSGLGAPSKGPGVSGEFTKQPGMMSFYEICNKIKNHHWRTENNGGPYATSGDQWVSYDDAVSLREKGRYVLSENLGGVAAWTIDLDDFSNTCCMEPYPLLRALNRALGLLKSSSPSKTDCNRPPNPVTPSAPILTTGVDTGANSESPWTSTSQSTTTTWWKPSTESTTPKTTPWTTISTTTSPKTTPKPSTDPGSKICEPGAYLPDENNCNAYFRCILGELQPQNCASGLHWNKNKNLCDWPSEAKCSNQQKRPQTTTPKPPTTTRAPLTTTPPDVPTNCQNGNYYPHKDCSLFYICVNGALVQQSCGPGLHWSITQNSCDWAPKNGCGPEKKSGKLRAKPYINLSKITECEGGTYATVPGDCTQYLMCLWGQYEQFQCASGLHWNAEKNICDWPMNAQCSNDPSTGSNNPGTTTMRPQVTTTTHRPITTTLMPEPLDGYYKIVCYFTNWAWYRQGIGKYVPEDIDANLCTHIVYGFAVLDYENLIIKAHDSWADYDNKFYERVVAYKKKGLKVSLALGGWNDSQGDKYSRLVNNPSARARFITQAIEFIEKWNFDGLDLDWEYPKCWQVDCKKGPDSDKRAFADFVRELSAAFKPKGLLLSAAVSPSKTVIDAGYEVPVLNTYLDWIAVMTYDYHGQWDKKTGHVAPLFEHPDDDVTFFNANFTLNYWISEGAESRKIVMGIPLYGQSFTLEKESNHGLNAPAPGPGQAGQFTRAAGFLAYYEICDKVLNQGWTVVQDPQGRMGPYAYKGNQWVSYDDSNMIKKKTELIKDLNLGGGMVWALDLDDFKNRCGLGVHPLMNTLRENLKTRGTHVQPTTESPRPPSATPQPPNTTPQPLQTSTVTEKITDLPHSTTQTSIPNTGYKMVCYFTNWAWYRQGGGKYLPSDIDPDLCTHIVYGFAVLNGDSLTIKPHDSWADFDNKFYEKVTAFKAKGIKVLIAIGGWNDSAGDKYSKLVNNVSSRRKFIEHVVDFIEKHNFDGLDLDWEYPTCWQVDCTKGPSSDKSSFAEFVKELRAAFKPRDWLLSAAVSPSKRVVDAGYDVRVLSDNLDWIAVMCYDYHGQWDKRTGHVAPMYEHDEDVDATFNTNFTIHYWIQQGADRKKLILGMPLYGQSFSLADNNVNGLNSPTYGGGEAGDATRARGFLSYYEICQNVQNKNWKVVRDRKGRMGPYAYLRDQWVSFDDVSMLQHKAEYIKAMNLGGGMVWALDLDDFKNYCGCEPYPLLRAINRVLTGYNKSPQPSCLLESKPRVIPSKPINKPSKNTPSTSCDGYIFKPFENDCQKYYICNQGQLSVQKCPQGLYWNTNHCDWPENTKCNPENPIVDVEPTEAPTEAPTEGTEEPPVGSEIEQPNLGGNDYKIICYFTNWAWYRQGDGKYKPEDIDSSLCTHITYGFAVLDSNSLTIKPHDSWADIDNQFYAKVTALKKKGIKVLIALGGWNDSLGDKYSRLVNNPSARARFITHVIEFIEKWNFDGLDLDWEYPKCWQVDCTKGPDSDKSGFASLVSELSRALRPKGLLLSAAVSPSKTVIDHGYDVTSLAQHFDWIAVMTYDFHGHWDKQTGHVAPLYYYPNDTYDYFNANFSLNYWLEKGAPANKIIMGLPLYGQSFTLADGAHRSLGAKTYGPGEAGEFTRAGGFLAYYEICERVKRRSWVVTRDPEGRIGPYASQGTQWVSYDDISEVRRKSDVIKHLKLGGAMIWALDLDDFRNRCGCGKHPLLRALNHALKGGNYPLNLSNCT